MQKIISALLRIARYIDTLAEKLREYSICKVQSEQLRQQLRLNSDLRDCNVERIKEEERHLAVLSRLGSRELELGEQCDCKIAALEQKAKDIELA